MNKLHYLQKHPITSGFGPKTFFDTASIGLVSSDVIDPDNKRNYSDKTVSWSLIVNDIKDNFSKIINTNPNEISIFHNTISAIERILTQLKNFKCFNGATLLTTDVEFPSVYAAMNEIWKDAICIVKISHLIYDTELDPTEKNNKIISSIECAIQTVKPSVVYISHVLRGSGYIIDIKKISDFCNKILPYKFFITDGAQAIGNIVVNVENDFKNVDAYVTSGHKWLCGPQHIGLLYSREKWMMDDPAHSYSLKVNSSGTGNKPLLIQFNQSLLEFFPIDGQPHPLKRMQDIAKNNKYLAEMFRQKIIETGNFQIISMEETNLSGLVVFRPINGTVDVDKIKIHEADRPDETEVSYNAVCSETINLNPWIKDRDRFSFFTDGNSINIEQLRDVYVIPIERQWFRVCFHFYHKAEDILPLVNSFQRAYHESNILPRKSQ